MKSFSCAIFFSRCALSRLDARADLRLRQHHVVVAAGVGDDRLVVDVGDVRADRVQEVAIVRDDDQRAVVADEELAQPVDRVEVEVVRRLVEQQRLRMAEQRLRQQHAHLLAALQLAPSSARGASSGMSRPCEQDRRVALGRVAVLLADDALRARRGACRRRRSCRPSRRARSRSSSALHRRWLPMITVSMTRNSSKANWSWRSTPSFAGPRDGALLRRQLAGQQLHERGLAGAVRPGQAVAAARLRTWW